MIRFFTSLCYPVLRKISPELKPIRELEHMQEGQWLSKGSDPQFLLQSSRFRILSGWVSIHVVMQSDVTLNPKVYLDFGEGYSELRAITLYQTETGSYRAEIMLPTQFKQMRFDPSDGICEFAITEVSIASHSEVLHVLHQFVSIMKHDFLKKNDPLRIVKKSFARRRKHGTQGALERLDREYKALHPYRIQRAASQHVAYMNWIRKHEKDVRKPFEQDKHVYQPLISVVMPVFNTPVKFLKEAIESIISQSYPHWELCIADDASTHQEIDHVLNEYREKYDNIYVYFRQQNGHISQATNTALGMARGEYVAFMDHDDKLAPHALKEVVKLLNRHPQLKLIYSDEDKIDECGNRYDSHFKSGWNPDMLFSQNYISHLSVIKRSIVEEAGRLCVNVEGAQDHDLLLRVLKYISDDEIGHIEKILYHWRSLEGSTAKDATEKAYTTRAGIRALQNYFDDVKPDVIVLEGLLPNTYHPIYPIPGISPLERIKCFVQDSQINQEILQEVEAKRERLSSVEDTVPLVSLIIPTRDGYELLSQCVESILNKTMYPNYEILIVDNQSTDRQTLIYMETLQSKYKNIKVLKYEKPFNYSAINNFAVAQARGSVVGLVNNDIEVISGEWLTEMVAHALREEIGAVGAKLHYDDGTIQHAGVILGIGGVAGHAHKYMRENHNGYFSRLKIIQNYSAVTAACMVVRKALFEKVEGLESERLTVAFNDIDFSLKLLEQGYRNVWTPYAKLYHYESKSRGAEDSAEKRARFNREIAYMKQKWGNRLHRDICYNRNLTLQEEKFTIRSHDTAAI